jgi:hypothetical protein
MFKKKECNKCKKKMNETYDFCPYCGSSSNENSKEDWGMLGKNDLLPSNNEIKLPMGLKFLVNTLMKNLNGQLENLEKENRNPNTIKKGGISINISTSGNRLPAIRINPSKNNPKFKQVVKEEIQMPTSFSEKNLKKFSNLPREEPLTNVRRLSDKVIYEINLPEVKSIEEVSITKLENSIEVKAISKDKAYFKLIPINLPLRNYNLSEGKLVLELGIK